MDAGLERYVQAKERRDKHVNAVLASTSERKVVVAGPGTGKTYLFRRILEKKRSSLTLSFINQLVDDLSIDLFGMSDVKTLHSFATELLRKSTNGKNIRIYPMLPEVIAEDLLFLTDEKVDFVRIFNTLDEENTKLAFYHERRAYYDNSYGHSDVVFAAVLYLKKNPHKIPSYDQILVDEFQDFNVLEVSLIDLLATQSPVLLAGDDDQALYDFKHADAKHIRERHADAVSFTAFNLPMCSRCTRVIVEASNDIVQAAVNRNLLKGRIEKPYEYFDDKDKDRICEAFPKITHCQIFPGQIAWLVETKLDEVARLIRGKFSVLVISPIRSHARKTAKALRNRGFQNVEFADRPEKGLALLDGLKRLLEDEESNLGWRIVASTMMNQDEVKRVVTRSNTVGPSELREHIPHELRKTVKGLLSILRKIRDGKSVLIEDIDVLRKHGIDPSAIGIDALGEEFRAAGRRNVKQGLRRIPIKVTTIQGSKGLADDVVFIIDLEDKLFIGKDGMTDKRVCNFLVALTRAKRKVFLVSSPSSNPTFVTWIAKHRLTVENAAKQTTRERE